MPKGQADASQNRVSYNQSTFPRLLVGVLQSKTKLLDTEICKEWVDNSICFSSMTMLLSYYHFPHYGGASAGTEGILSLPKAQNTSFTKFILLLLLLVLCSVWMQTFNAIIFSSRMTIDLHILQVK